MHYSYTVLKVCLSPKSDLVYWSLSVSYQLRRPATFGVSCTMEVLLQMVLLCPPKNISVGIFDCHNEMLGVESCVCVYMCVSVCMCVCALNCLCRWSISNLEI